MFSKADIEKYFLAEKQAGLMFLVIGLLAVILAIIFFVALKTNFYKGAALPLLIVGLLECVIGFAVYKRSDGDRVRNVYAYDMNPDQLKREEWPRMKKVNRSFTIIKWVEILLALAGIGLAFYFKANPEKSFWYGLGITLTIQAVVALGADYYAEKRALIYTKGLESYLVK
jgi:ABC-type xylose transport system permease subunit